jgi:PBP1b-binding outer membrane lipoprotein LpoB
MKKFSIMAVVALGALSLTSCKDEAKMNAEKKVDQYVAFIDSVNNIAAAERAANWEAIQHEYEVMTAKADSSLAVLENDAKTSEKIQSAKVKYDSIKVESIKVVREQTAAAGNTVADALFGAGKVVGDDKSFAWVNKDNILSVYQTFYDNFKANRESYSREELDKIKAWYEALDARKNTVEKEGLSGSDNNKIAAIKLKFAPMFKWDRITAKGEENKEAKEEADK